MHLNPFHRHKLVKFSHDLANSKSWSEIQILLSRPFSLIGPDVDRLLTEVIQQVDEPQKISELLVVRTFLHVFAQHTGEMDQVKDSFKTLPLIQSCPLPEIYASNELDPLDKLLPLASSVLEHLRPESEPRLFALIANVYAQGQYAAAAPDLATRVKQLREVIRFSETASRLLISFPNGNEQEARREALQLLDHGLDNLARLDLSLYASEVIPVYEQKLMQEDWSKAPGEQARFQHSLGSLYSQRPGLDRCSDIEIGIQWLKKVLLSTDKVTTIQLVISLVALGNAYINRIAGQRVENLDQALNIYSRAERIVIPLRNPERQAELFLNIAVAKRLRAQETVNIDLSDRFIDEGLKYSELALVNFRQVNARVMLSTVYCEQGTLYYNRSSDRAASLNQAVQCYQKALAVIQRTEAPMLWANTHDDLANALGERDHTQRADRINDLKCAVGHYQEALSVFRQDNYPQQWANVNNNLGATYLDLGNQVAAERCFKAALGVHTPDAFPGEAKLVAQNLGNLYFSQGQWQSAWEYYQIALQSSERQYQASEFDLGKQAEQSKRFLLTQRSAYTLIKLNQPGEALETLEHEKARLLNEHMQTRANPPGGVSHEHWKDYLECFDQVRNNKIQDYQINSQLSSIPDDRENRQKALLNLKRAVDTIRQEAPDFLQDMDLDAIRTILPNPQTALIAFCMTERGGFAIILTQCPDSVKVVELSDLTPRFVNHWLSGEVPDLDHRRQAAKTMESAPEPQPGSWLFACNNITNKDHQKNSFEALEQSLSVIGASLVEPILATIPDEIQSLMILPTGGLFLIPFHAAYLPKNGMRLLDIYKVSYIPSAKVLHHQLLPPAQPGSRCLLGIIASQASRLEFRGAMQEALLQLKTPGTSGYWNQVEVIEGSGCTEDNVFIEAKKASALHFYGHGVFNPRSPKDSCLHLTGDTRLTLEKMQANRTDLSSIRLLTLTACEAGQIDTAEVPEEYLSLAAGFMQLGIACVISPLWRVPEESSVLLMDAFYQFYTQGYSPSSALQAAQQKISSFTYADLAKTSLYAKIEVKDQCMTAANRHDFYCRMVRTKAEVRPFENPFYWAAFTVNGAG